MMSLTLQQYIRKNKIKNNSIQHNTTTLKFVENLSYAFIICINQMQMKILIFMKHLCGGKNSMYVIGQYKQFSQYIICNKKNIDQRNN